jgi:hypothetical protein
MIVRVTLDDPAGASDDVRYRNGSVAADRRSRDDDSANPTPRQRSVPHRASLGVLDLTIVDQNGDTFAGRDSAVMSSADFGHPVATLRRTPARHRRSWRNPALDPFRSAAQSVEIIRFSLTRPPVAAGQSARQPLACRRTFDVVMAALMTRDCAARNWRDRGSHACRRIAWIVDGVRKRSEEARSTACRVAVRRRRFGRRRRGPGCHQRARRVCSAATGREGYQL